MSALRSWRKHMAELGGGSISLGIVAVLIALLIFFVMVRAGDYSIVPMSAALLASALALAIFVPKRIVNFIYALIALIFALRALVIGKFFFAVSMAETPLYYWLGVGIMLAGVVWFAYQGHQAVVAPPNSTAESDARNGGARGSP